MNEKKVEDTDSEENKEENSDSENERRLENVNCDEEDVNQVDEEEERNFKESYMREWDAIWMMHGAAKRKGIENYQLLELRKVVKANEGTVQKDFREKYRVKDRIK